MPPVLGTPVPIAWGFCHVDPSRNEAFRLATSVEDVTVMEVKAPVFGVVLPIAAGTAQVEFNKNEA